MKISSWVLLRMWNVSDKSCTENQNTHFVFSNVIFKSYHLWDNVGKYCTARKVTDNKTRRVSYACWIKKATDTHTQNMCDTYCISKATVVTRTRLIVALSVNIIHYGIIQFWKRIIGVMPGKNCKNMNYYYYYYYRLLSQALFIIIIIIIIIIWLCECSHGHISVAWSASLCSR